MKTYAAKSSVTRAAKKAGIPASDYTIKEVDGKFCMVDNDLLDYFSQTGETHCPHCTTALDNGISQHGDDVNGEALKHETNEYACLACGHEFGPAIQKTKKRDPNAPKREIKEHSTVQKPTKLVWEIASRMLDDNPEVARKEIMNECIAAGIAFYTARTQIQLWSKAVANSK